MPPSLPVRISTLKLLQLQEALGVLIENHVALVLRNVRERDLVQVVSVLIDISPVLGTVGLRLRTVPVRAKDHPLGADSVNGFCNNARRALRGFDQNVVKSESHAQKQIGRASCRER